jgi:hypothetical protein
MYRPPHQRKEARKEFRNEFPELCPKAEVKQVLSFTHIKDIVEPEPIKIINTQFISLKDPANYRKPEIVFSEKRVYEAFEKMVNHWEKNEQYQNYNEKYPIIYSDESDETEELSSLEAEDQEYESDF